MHTTVGIRPRPSTTVHDELQSTMKTAVAFLSVAVGASAFAPSASVSKASGLKASADFEGVIGSDSLETGKRMVGYMPVENWRHLQIALHDWIFNTCSHSHRHLFLV